MKSSYSVATGTIDLGDYDAAGLRVQLYHPFFKVENGKHQCTGVSVHANSALRLAFNSGYRNEHAFAVKVLGFGFGISHVQYKSE